MFTVIFYIYAGITVIGIFIALVMRFSGFENKMRLNPELIVDEDAFVSIIIPTRNEERNIGNCLESLTNLNYPNYEILVVDGNSEDTTQEIVKQYNQVQLIIEEPRPENWVGKVWGCYTGYQKSKGDILLFTDADTIHKPSSLRKTVAELQNSDGFVTLLTTQILKTFWEHIITLIGVVVLVATMGLAGSNRPYYANGQYMMFTREIYEKLGTHEIVSHDISDDLAFSIKSLEKGYPVKMINENSLVMARMYQSLGEIIDGFAKNMLAGADYTGNVAFFRFNAVSVWGSGWMIFLIIERFIYDTITLPTLYLSIFAFLTYSIFLYWIETIYSTKGSLYVLCYPLYVFILYVITFKSIYFTYIKKEIPWKGRKYTVQG